MSKHCVLFFLLIFSHFMMAQKSVFDSQIKEIDSLIQYNQFEAAQRKTDSLYQHFNSSKEQKKHKAGLLELKFRQALILDRQDRPSSEPLQILLEITDEAEAERLHSLSCRIYLLMALAYEKSDNLELTDKYLRLAYKKYKTNKLEEVYSTYCIRKSSYHRHIKELDSLLYYAERAEEYAEKYHNETDLTDSYILLGIVASRTKNYKEGLKYSFLLLDYRKKFNDTVSIFSSYNNIASDYLKMENFSKALLYNDSAYVFYEKLPLLYRHYSHKLRYEIYDAVGNTDSAYYYFKQYHNNFQ
ncbi:MAG: hypothetical protein WCY89_04420, partial [Flavobacteriaceae bacterium]